MRKFHVIALLFPFLMLGCQEKFDFTVQSSSEASQQVALKSITINVIRPDGTPMPNAIIGTIPTLNATGTERGSDGKDRTLVTERFATDEKGQFQIANRTFDIVQSPLFFNAYSVDATGQQILRGSTFLDLEVAMNAEQVLTVVMESVPVINPTVRIALMDGEPFPRAVDLLTREGILFDNLVYDRIKTGASWDTVLSASNLNTYDVLIVGLDASRYAEFDQLVQHSAALIDFIKNNPNKLLFLCQQHVANFNWNWLADFDVPAQGVGGGFLAGVYTEVPHFDTGKLTTIGGTHPLFVGTPLADPADANLDGVADVWQGWEHIEPNKPEIKPRVAWHGGNALTFQQFGWDLLVAGPALAVGDMPAESGVIAAEKRFANGSRIFFCQATYYQASYGPRKAVSAMLLKDRIVKYLATWPQLRGQ